jgi:23S rRNA pseudouridine955/2504/2580 synthase
MKTYTIKPNDADQRLDKFIRKAFVKLSLPSIFKYIRTKRVKVNGKKAAIDYKLQVGDKVDLYINDILTEKTANKNDFLLAKDKLDIIYEDDNIIVVNKPIGVVVQDDDTKTVDTLCNRLLKYLYNKKL